MGSPARRTIIIDRGSKLSCREGQLMITGYEEEATVCVPLFDIRTIMVVSTRTTLSVGLVNELHKRHISLIFCDEKKMPFGEFIGYHSHHASSAKLREQIQWKSVRRREIWTLIIQHKINMQRKLLQRLELNSDWNKWSLYCESLRVGDRSNREGQAARLYFNALFGKRFQRRVESPINAALNYGYAILCSVVTRNLTSHGYHPGLGIAHRGGTNPLNFTYDLMEPFRPFVDEVVFHGNGKELDHEFKQELVAVANRTIGYRHKRMTLSLAADQYLLDVINALTSTQTLPVEPEF